MECSWIEKINIVTGFMLSKAIYRFNVITTKIPMAFFTKQDNAKYVQQHTKMLKNVKQISSLGKNNKAGSIVLHGFKLYYKVVIIDILLAYNNM